MDESAISRCHPWMEESHSWMKVSSVDVIQGWRKLIHGWHLQMKMTNDGHGWSQCCCICFKQDKKLSRLAFIHLMVYITGCYICIYIVSSIYQYGSLSYNRWPCYVIESLNMCIKTRIIKTTPEFSRLNQCVSLSVATTTISISKVLIFRPQKMKAPLFLITCVDTYWIFTSFKWIFITFKGN